MSLYSPVLRSIESAVTANGGGDADVALVGALLGDAGRCRMLLALDDGRFLPAGRLAVEANISASTASHHLAKLVAAGLLTVERHGRHRYYGLAGPQVGALLEALIQVAPAAPVRSLRQHTQAEALRGARTCYDHLAGRLGVNLMRVMIERGQIEGGDGLFDSHQAHHDRRCGFGRDIDYQLSEAGRSFLTDFRINLPAQRAVIRYCIDWSEQAHHLAGGLGRGLLDRLTELEWIRPIHVNRAVQITPLGATGLQDAFGILARVDRSARLNGSSGVAPT
jgi:DNA-binding transcriptional ArsR family regulator